MAQETINKNEIPVSIIVPVYNAGKYIRRCLESIQGQTFTKFECILVDDFSSDISSEICDEYCRHNIRILTIHNSYNMGASQSRLTGLEAARGEYVLFVDSDDWCEKNMLELLYGKAVRDTNDIVFCNFYSERQMKYSNTVNGLKSTEVMQHLFKKKIAFLWNKLVKRELHLRSFFPKADYLDDVVINVQIVSYAKSIGFVEDFLYNYTLNRESICENKEGAEKRRLDCHENIRKIAEFLKEKYGGLVGLYSSAFNGFIRNRAEKFGDDTLIRYCL